MCPGRVFSPCWNPSFHVRQSTVSMVFSQALTKGSLIPEWRAKPYKNNSNDDSIFNFIYFIKMKDFIVKTTRSLWAEWITKTLSIVNVNFLGRKHGSHGQIAKEHSKNYIQRNKRYHTNKGKKFPLNGDCFRKWIL